MNEEEIKIKYVLPWLVQTGLDVRDLQFERSFSVKIGRHAVSVGASGSKDTVGARLDILVRKGDKNLFVIETKAGDVALSEGDRDQAISYARLVHPVAPYAVVTNGSDYQLYETLSKNRVNLSEIRVRGFEAALPEEDIAEAQKLFLSLSRKNLVAFCQQQVADELRILKGRMGEDRKYIPELHVPRYALVKEVENLYESASTSLLLVGKSGSGKTCELCWIAEWLVQSEKPVLFFSGVALEEGILDAIAKEFLWSFSGSDAPIEIVKRLTSFVGDGVLTIIVDAIDEWTFEARSNHLASLLRAVEKQKIKVILSCKTSAVEEFLLRRGTPTMTGLLAKRVDVPAFSEKEFYRAIQRYRSAYRFTGAFEDAVLQQARENPFLLRILFDVAGIGNAKHLTFSSAEFFETYYKKVLDKTSNPRRAEETVKAIARLLYEREVDWILESDVRASLNLGINESLMEELFEYGILIRSLGDAGGIAVGFYFQQLRDYIIAFKVRQFVKLSASLLGEEIKNVGFHGMRGDVFTFYYRLAPKEHKVLFDAEMRANAEEYLRCYTSLIQRYFPAMQAAFKPRTSGRIGFIGELVLSQRSLGAYGFRAIREGDDEVHFVPVQQVLGKSNLSYLEGADGLHLTSSACGFRNGIDITKEVVENELLPQLRRLLEAGELDETGNPELLVELVVETVSQQKGIFKQLLSPDQRKIRYPLKLSATLECVLREKLVRHFEEENIEKRREKGEIQEAWNGSIISYSYSFSPQDREEISQNVERTLSLGKIPVLRAREVGLEQLERSLSMAVNALGATGDEIAVPLFPTVIEMYRYRDPGYMADLKDYLERLYSAFLRNYAAIVERNFPTLRAQFKLYSQLPASVYLETGSPSDADRSLWSIPQMVYFVKAGSNPVFVRVVDKVDCVRAGDHFQCHVEGAVHEGISWESTSVGNAIESNGGLARTSFRSMPLRRLVYSTLHRELSAVADAFRREVKASAS